MESSEERILFLLKTRGPQTAATLATQLNMTVVGARQHLASLHEQALVDQQDRRSGVGRPKRYWLLTEQAQQRFPDTHAHLTVELLKAAHDLFGEAGIDKLIAKRETESLASYQAATAKCWDLASRVKKLAELRSQEGYMAEWKIDTDGGYWLIENHCPICAAAAQCQGFCRSELIIFQKIIGPDATIERVEHMLSGARRCAYRITPVAGYRINNEL